MQTPLATLHRRHKSCGKRHSWTQSHGNVGIGKVASHREFAIVLKSEIKKKKELKSQMDGKTNSWKVQKKERRIVKKDGKLKRRKVEKTKRLKRRKLERRKVEKTKRRKFRKTKS